jgi:hypothetical protein
VQRKATGSVAASPLSPILPEPNQRLVDDPGSIPAELLRSSRSHAVLLLIGIAEARRGPCGCAADHCLLEHVGGLRASRHTPAGSDTGHGAGCPIGDRGPGLLGLLHIAWILVPIGDDQTRDQRRRDHHANSDCHNLPRVPHHVVCLILHPLVPLERFTSGVRAERLRNSDQKTHSPEYDTGSFRLTFLIGAAASLPIALMLARDRMEAGELPCASKGFRVKTGTLTGRSSSRSPSIPAG